MEALAVILAITALACLFGGSIAIVLIILSIALLIIGIIKVIGGISFRCRSKATRVGMIGVGTLSMIVAVMIMATLFGFFIVPLILCVTLPINGIESIISGITVG